MNPRTRLDSGAPGPLHEPEERHGLWGAGKGSRRHAAFTAPPPPPPLLQPFWSFGGGGGRAQDVESGMLYPGADALENSLRWGFVRKVFAIISCQLVLTTVVAAVVIFTPAKQWLFQNFGVQLALLLVSMLALVPLYIYRTTHPYNLVLLGVWTCLFSVTVGMACSFYQPEIVLEALFLTAAVVVALTAYAFHATRQGTDLTFMGPALYGCLLAMLVWSVIQIFWPPGPVGRTIFALMGSFLFRWGAAGRNRHACTAASTLATSTSLACLARLARSCYLVFDIQLLIQRMDLDEYIWAGALRVCACCDH